MSDSYSQGLMITLGIAFLIIPATAVGFRVWAKMLGRKGLAWDDLLIFAALIVAIACCVVQLIAATRGQLEQHQTVGSDGQPILTDPRFLIYERCKFAGQILATVGLGFTKASILVFYMNIFSTPRFRIVAQIMLAIVTAWTVSFFFSNLFTCYPVTALVEAFYHHKCIDGVSMWYSSCISDIIVDFLILAMPIPMVMKLQLPLKQRLAVLGIFLLGATVCGISITRFVMYRHVGSGFLAHYNDETYYTSPVFFWTNIELSTSVVSACLPTLRPIYIHFKSPPPSNDNSVPLSSYPKLSSRYGRRSRSGRRMSDTFDEQERIALRNNSNVEPVLSPGSQK